MLTSYSHTTHLADLRQFIAGRPLAVVPAALAAFKRPWNLRDRLDERTRADLMTAYLAGTTAASLATTDGLSLRSVKRVLASAGVRRKRLPT